MHLQVAKKKDVNSVPEITQLTADNNFLLEDFEECKEYSFYVVATDPEGDYLTYSWNCNKGSFLTSVTKNEIIWKAPDFQFEGQGTMSGDIVISVIVSDGKETTTERLTKYYSIGSWEDVDCGGN